MASHDTMRHAHLSRLNGLIPLGTGSTFLATPFLCAITIARPDRRSVA